MYLRFVLARRYLPGRQRKEILHSNPAPRHRKEEVRRIYAWLNRNLPVPHGSFFSSGRGLCWFKTDAHSCIDQVRTLARVLEEADVPIWQVFSRNPGLITYEDEYQVVAIPLSSIGRG